MSESSFDGSLNQSDSVNFATWASTSSPGEEDHPVSPIKQNPSHPDEHTTPIRPGKLHHDTSKNAEDSLHDSLEEDPKRSPLPPLHYVEKLTSYLANQGFTIPPLQDMDLNPQDNSVPVQLVDTWANSILTAVCELSERIQEQRKTVSSVSSEYRAQNASKEVLLGRIADLQTLVLDLEKREKSLQNRLLEQERQQEKKGKGERAGEQELTRKLRGMEAQVQELSRRLRQKEVDFDKLRVKMSDAAKKEREERRDGQEKLQHLLDLSTHTNTSSVNTSVNTSHGNASKATIPSRTPTTPGKATHPGGANKSPTAASASVSASSLNPQQLRAVVEELLRERAALQRERDDLSCVVRKLESDLKLKLSPQEAEVEEGGSARRRGVLSEEDVEALVLTSRVYHTLHTQHKQLLQEHEDMSYAHQILQRRLEEVSKERSELEEIIEKYGYGEGYAQKRVYGGKLGDVYVYGSKQGYGYVSLKDYRSLEEKYQDLQEKHKAYLFYPSNTPNAPHSKYLSTAEQVLTDKLNFKLKLHLLDDLDKHMLLDVVKELLRELKLSDLSELVPCIARLRQAVNCIPILERWVVYVGEYVTSRQRKLDNQAERGDGKEGGYLLMEEVKKILPNCVQECLHLRDFKEAVLKELYRGQVMLAHRTSRTKIPDDADLHTMWQREGRLLWGGMGGVEEGEVCVRLRELIDFQYEVLCMEGVRDGKSVVASYIHTRPDLLITRVISHIMSLFQIPEKADLGVCVSKVNQVYIQHQEYTRFIRSLCLALGKPVDDAVGGERDKLYVDVLHIINKYKLSMQDAHITPIF
eukprot:gene30377-36705_t